MGKYGLVAQVNDRLIGEGEIEVQWLAFLAALAAVLGRG